MEYTKKRTKKILQKILSAHGSIHNITNTWDRMIKQNLIYLVCMQWKQPWLTSTFPVIGTNNARSAANLRQLAVYHAKDPNNLFCVRLAQGLTHLGKGTLTLCPFHSDRALLSNVAVGGLMAVLVACLDVKNSKWWNSSRQFCVDAK